jgi:hypothetical protein
MFNYQNRGGPNFNDANRFASWIEFSEENSQPRGIWELPITAGFTRTNFTRRQQRWMRARTNLFRKLRLPGILDRTGVATKLKLSPEGNPPKRLCQLVSASLAEGADILVLLLHSSSLSVGHSPYCPTQSALDELYDCLSTLLRYVQQRYCAKGVTLTQVADHLDATSEPSVMNRNQFQ